MGTQFNGEYRRAWQRIVAHVPQSIFLADASLAQNIAFGVLLWDEPDTGGGVCWSCSLRSRGPTLLILLKYLY